MFLRLGIIPEHHDPEAKIAEEIRARREGGLGRARGRLHGDGELAALPTAD